METANEIIFNAHKSSQGLLGFRKGEELMEESLLYFILAFKDMLRYGNRYVLWGCYLMYSVPLYPSKKAQNITTWSGWIMISLI